MGAQCTLLVYHAVAQSYVLFPQSRQRFADCPRGRINQNLTLPAGKVCQEAGNIEGNHGATVRRRPVPSTVAFQSLNVRLARRDPFQRVVSPLPENQREKRKCHATCPCRQKVQRRPASWSRPGG